MMSRIAFSTVTSMAMACAASAGVTVSDSLAVWSNQVTSGGETVGVETFNSISAGWYPSLSGTVSNTYWTATADSGLMVSQGAPQTFNALDSMVFTFSPGVRAVAGNIFGSRADHTVLPSFVNVTLSDGTSWDAITNDVNDFVGFYSSTANITSLTIFAADLNGSEPVFATINNLYLGVPAPGAAALLGLAGLATRRRRA
ncbi:MAG: hypothetical protein EBR71_11970 [Planctomycetes bacterium]|nr:hypothetical protein [Planctomycetota bacterium]